MSTKTNQDREVVNKVNPKRYLYFVLGFYLSAIVIRSSNAVPQFNSTRQHSSAVAGHAAGTEDPIQEEVDYEYDPDGSTWRPAPAPAHGSQVDASHSQGQGASTGHDQNGEAHADAGAHEGHGGGIHVSVVDFAHVSTPFIISAWILCACFAKVGFHVTPKLEHIFPESCLLIVLGVIIGLILYSADSLRPPLTPTAFFLFMLPPIILDAGYFMPNKMFFNNLGTILLFAVIATVWNTFTIGLSLWGLGTAGVFGVELPLLQTLLFSSLISAVDPVAVLAVFEEIHVNEVLYIVVFGESLLNDAVTVVLYHIFEGFSEMGAENVTPEEVLKGVASFPVVALGGTAIGIIWGFVIGFTTRFTNQVRIIEPLFVFVMAYLSYLCAEVFHMSGILAITFCGITMKNYVEANISQKSHTTVKYTMKMMSSSAETIIFVFLGVATIHDTHYWSWWFVIATIVFCSVYRVIGVIIFTYFANKYRIHKLGFVDQFVMSYGGLRGAVAFALVLLIKPETVQGDENLRRMFVTTTITVVFFTVFAQGITIKPLVEWLKVARADSRKETIAERIHEKVMDHVMAGVETLLGQVGHNNLRQRFKQFDQRYIRPYLIRDQGQGDEPKILETYARLILEDAMVGDMKYKPPPSPVHIKVNGHAHVDATEASINNISPEALATLIKNVLMDTMSDADISSIVKRRKSSVRPLDFNGMRKDSVVELNGTAMQNGKCLTPAKIDNILSQPNLTGRRLSYSRHSVNESDIDGMVNHRVPIHFKRMLGDHALHERRPTLSYINQAFNYEDESETKVKSDKEQEANQKKSPSDTLPWKSDADGNGVPQKEFPSWAANKDYVCVSSPTVTYLGGIEQPPTRTSVTTSDLFKRGQCDIARRMADDEGERPAPPPPPPPVTGLGTTSVPIFIIEEHFHQSEDADDPKDHEKCTKL